MSVKAYIGDKAFYRRVLSVSVPIMIQMGITNFVNLLDNVMVGRLCTESMSGVSIVNQFIFIYNLLIFGAISAAGIFTAQYHGLGDVKGERDTFRFKLIINLAASVIGIVAFALLDEQLISLFLHAGSAEGDLALTLSEGKAYLFVILFGLVPYAVSQVYASTMRETGQTVMPAVASSAAVGINFVLNYLLIFGHLGLPAMGVRGAALATVISRFVEVAIVAIWGHTHTKKCPFLKGAYRSLLIPRSLTGKIAVKGLPLMLNEVFWALAMTMRNQCYSLRGLDVVGAQNINSTIFNLFNVVYMAIGSSIAIIVGSLLGAGKTEEARDTDRKMIAFSVTCGTVLGGLLILASPFFPMIYKTTDAVRSLASYMIVVSAATMPFCAFAHAAYYTLRSGGRVGTTLLLDSVFMWVVAVPIAFFLANFTEISILWLFPICQCAEVIKAFVSAILLRRGTWVRQLVGGKDAAKNWKESKQID